MADGVSVTLEGQRAYFIGLLLVALSADTRIHTRKFYPNFSLLF